MKGAISINFFTVTVTVCCFFSLLRLYLTLWRRGICALVWRFCFGFSNELSCMWRGKCVWLEWQCRRDKSLFDGAAVRMSLFVWACWFSEGSGGKGYARDSHPQCVCVCVCARECYLDRSSWAQRACPWQGTHIHNNKTVLCWKLSVM